MKTEENKRIEALTNIIADLKAENMELEQRVHQLMELTTTKQPQHGMEKQTLGEMLKMRDHDCEHQKEELFKQIARFENSAFVEMGFACIYRGLTQDGKPVKVGSNECCTCRHLIKVDVFGRKCVLCACRYDKTKAEDAQECKSTDD